VARNERRLNTAASLLQLGTGITPCVGFETTE
jgi:hypothetical protein